MTESLEPRLEALLREAREKLDPVDAEWLLAHALGRPRAWLYAHADDKVDAGTQARFAELIARRAAGEPVAYLTRSRGFWSFDLRVTPDTLIPRPETELLVELALARLPETAALRIADLGTGSGAIALALARERPCAHVFATDISEAALAIACENAAALAIGNVRFGSGSWCSALAGGPFDLIASNPPYIADDDPHLAAGDLRFEPLGALASGHDGLDAIRAIIRDAAAHLVPGGWLLLEHGVAQGSAVRALLHAAGFIDVGTARDLEDRDRVTLGRRSA
ncbi:MAG TPA: peptide chain release factor N(5)-glutamine methyltransferase [Luteimonas sp.]